jgi:protein-L-isoaspartate O-methyltransferase
MSANPRSVAQRAISALPTALGERTIVRDLAHRLADEILRYGVGTLPGQRHTPDGAHVLEQICEDIEAAQLLAEYLAPQREAAEELTPEQRLARILDKAEQVQRELAGGLSLQEAIRRELADTDCGACDHPTCDLYSIALANGTDKDNTKCEPGGPKVTAQVELVMTVAKGAPVQADKILAIEALAAESGKREGGPRVLVLGSGHGFMGAALAQIYPDVEFTLIEAELRRVWFLKRLVNLLGVRNCTIRTGAAEHYLERLADRFDLVLVPSLLPDAAFALGLPFARPGGRVLNLQDENWSERAAEYQRHGLGRRLPLHRPLEFSAAPIAGHVFLVVMRPQASTTAAAEQPQSDAVAV